MEEADQLCDRIAIIDHGRIIALATPTDLKHSLDDKKLFTVELEHWQESWGQEMLAQGARNLTARFDGSSRHHELTLHLNGGLTAGEALTFLVNQGAGVVTFATKEVSLEDVFIHLTGKSLRE
ncbi:MAG: DUF4162 domain-containing protein [Bacillota bacterium]